MLRILWAFGLCVVACGEVDPKPQDTDTISDADADTDADSDDTGDADADADADADSDDTGDADADADADADVSGVYEGTWELDITTLIGGDTCSGPVEIVVIPDDDPEVTVEAECSFPEGGWVSSLMGLGLVDTLGPYGGDMDGALDGTTGVFGTLEFDLTGGEPISIDWAAEFGPGGTLSGEIDGEETIPVDILGEIVLNYEVAFDVVKVSEIEEDAPPEEPEEEAPAD